MSILHLMATGYDLAVARAVVTARSRGCAVYLLSVVGGYAVSPWCDDHVSDVVAVVGSSGVIWHT